MNVNFQHANLRLLRQLHDNLPQKYVAHYLGVSQVAYCKMERGEVNVSLLHLRKICRLFFCRTVAPDFNQQAQRTES